MTNNDTSHDAPDTKPGNRKGFDAPRSATYVFDPDDLVIAGIDDKSTDSDPLYDPRITLALSDEMVDNVMTLGVIQPITVVKRDGKPYVVDGRQRVRLARAANEKLAKHGHSAAFIEKYGDGIKHVRIEAKVARGDDVDLMSLASATNSVRIEETLLMKAERAKKLLAAMPAKQPEPEKYRALALAFGVSETAIRQWVAITDAAAPVRRAVERGEISASAAGKIAKAGTPSEQVAALDELLKAAEKGEKPTSKAATKAAGKRKAKKDADEEPVPTGGLRGKRKIVKGLKAVRDNKLRMSAEEKAAAICALEWVLGSDLADYDESDKLVRTFLDKE